MREGLRYWVPPPPSHRFPPPALLLQATSLQGRVLCTQGRK